MLKQTAKACKQDPALGIGLFGLIISRNGSALQQTTFINWLNSYSGELSDVNKVWQYQNLATNICALPFIMIAGRLSDKVSAKVSVPATIIFQIANMVMYMFCTDPASWYGYLCALPSAGSTMMIIVTM